MDPKRLTIRPRWLAVVVALAAAVAMSGVAVAAGGAFTDDDSSIFEADIEWLAQAGVTKGCNPPANTEFCPDEDVTRGQMAAFMRRFAQFLGAEDGTVDSADALDGRDLAQVRPTLLSWSSDGLGTDDFSQSLSISVPAGGARVGMAGSFDFLNTAGTTDWMECLFRWSDGTVDDYVPGSLRHVDAGPSEMAVCATNGFKEFTTPGIYEIRFLSNGADGIATMIPGRATFQVTVIPNG